MGGGETLMLARIHFKLFLLAEHMQDKSILAAVHNHYLYN